MVASLLHRIVAAALAVTLLAACGDSSGPPQGNPPTSLSGTAQDPAGDGGTADMVGVTVTADVDSVIFQTNFAPGVLGSGDRWVIFTMDIDNQTSTGDATRDPPGAEYEVLVAEDRQDVTVYHYESGSWAGLGTFGAIYISGNTLTARIPRTAFGGDEGGLRFKVSSSTLDPGCSCYTQQDLLPDAGMPPAVVQ